MTLTKKKYVNFLNQFFGAPCGFAFFPVVKINKKKLRTKFKKKPYESHKATAYPTSKTQLLGTLRPILRLPLHFGVPHTLRQ